MPYLLRNTSSSSFVSLGSNITLTPIVGNYIEFSCRASASNVDVNWSMASRGSFTDFIDLTATAARFRGSNNTIREYTVGYTKPAVNTDFILRLEVTSTNVWEMFLNGVSLGTSTLSNNLIIGELLSLAGSGTANSFVGDMHYVEMCTDGTAVATNRWENTTGTGTTWIDQIGTNNASQVGTWPADDSEWVLIGPAVDYTIRKGSTATITHTLTAAGLTSATLNGQAVTIGAQSGQTAEITFTDTIVTSGVYDLVLGDGVGTQTLTVQYNVIGFPATTIKKDGAVQANLTDIEITLMTGSFGSRAIAYQVAGAGTDASGISGAIVVPNASLSVGGNVYIVQRSFNAGIGIAYGAVLELL